MSIKKKLMAAILAVSLTASMVIPAIAATKSPTGAPTTEPANPGFEVKINLDNNLQDHNHDVLVRSRVTSSAAVVHDVTHKPGIKPVSFVSMSVARDKDNKKRNITHIGNGSSGVFDSQKGRCVTSATIGSPAKVNINTNAFKGSNVSTLRIKSKFILRKNAFSGTRKKDVKIYIIGAKKTAADMSFASGAFTGLSSKAVFSVSASTMTAAEFNKLKTKLIKAGFPGKIVRK